VTAKSLGMIGKVLRHDRECAGAVPLIEDVNRNAGAFPIMLTWAEPA
jgi:hypothetical protein